MATPENSVYTFTAADFGFSDANDVPPDLFINVNVLAVNVPLSAGALSFEAAIGDAITTALEYITQVVTFIFFVIAGAIFGRT